MKISSKMLKTSVFTFLAILLVVGASPFLCTVKAQSTASVTIVSSIGGTTSPGPGTQLYSSGVSETVTATPDAGYFFDHWILLEPESGPTVYTDNPLTLSLPAGIYQLQPVFGIFNVTIPIALPGPAPVTTDAVVVVVYGVGGTTNPGPGTYLLANAASLNLMATPLSGWKFDHWVIGGYPMSHGSYSFTDTPTDNPYNVNHGYGNAYYYQPVFSLVSSSSATPTATTPEFSSAAVIGVVVALIAVLLASGLYAYGKRK